MGDFVANCNDEGHEHTPVILSKDGGVRFVACGGTLPSQLQRCTTCGHSWACFTEEQFRES